ncbi:MAG TPA: hypothetical protein VLK25_03470 [Allosphingosinicella sp.]|nr:hypothetical protein [Allosphingosinicella sp.]
MKRILAPVSCVALLVLAGCGESAPPANDAGPKIRIANPGSDRLKALSPIYPRVALVDVIRRNGKRCQRVERLAYQQDYQQLAMWVALCDNGKHWAVFIAPNDDVQVRDCEQHAQLGLPVCRPLPPLPHDPNAPPSAEPANQSDTNLL